LQNQKPGKYLLRQHFIPSGDHVVKSVVRQQLAPSTTKRIAALGVPSSHHSPQAQQQRVHLLLQPLLLNKRVATLRVLEMFSANRPPWLSTFSSRMRKSTLYQ
jgi:hypothetical protein